jgi:hypothetical protein
VIGPHRDHCDRALRHVQRDRLTRLQAGGVGLQALRARAGRDHPARVGQEVTAAPIEIVGVVVMRDQHHVDRFDLLGGHGRSGQLVEDHRCSGPRVIARRIEGRIREQSQPPVGDQRGGAAD